MVSMRYGGGGGGAGIGGNALPYLRGANAVAVLTTSLPALTRFISPRHLCNNALF